METWTKPIYKIKAQVEIPQIIRGKEKGVVTVYAEFISRYKTAKEIMLNQAPYFFGVLKLKNDEKKQYEKRIRFKGEEIIAETNTYYKE